MINQFLKLLESRTSFDVTDRELRVKLTWIIRIRWIVLGLLLLIIIAAASQGLVIEENHFVETARDIIRLPLDIGNPEKLVTNAGHQLYVTTMGTFTGRLNFQSILTFVAVLLNAIYHLLKNRVKRLRLFISMQLILDVFTYAGVVYNTGGVLSPFIFLFYFPIISAGILYSFRFSLLITTFSSLIYGVVALVPRANLFSPILFLEPSPSYFTLNFTIQVFSFYMIVLLSGILLRLISQREKQLVQVNAFLNENLRSLGAIYEVAETVKPGSSQETVIDSILAIMVERLGFHRVIYFAVGHDANQLRIEQVRPKDSLLQKRTLPLRDDNGAPAGIVATVALSGDPVNIREPVTSGQTNVRAMDIIGTNPFAAIPVVLRGRVVGVIGADRSRSEEAISDELFRLLVMFANQVALSLSQ